jgi:hypothetical protein
MKRSMLSAESGCRRVSWVAAAWVLCLGAPELLAEEVLSDFGATWSFFRGAVSPDPGSADPPTAWRTPAYNDSSWESGPAAIGYEAALAGFMAPIATELDDMQMLDDDPATPGNEAQPGYAAFYARREFTLTQGQINALTAPVDPANVLLSVAHDDGFVCFVNGTEVARFGLGAAGTDPTLGQLATGHEADEVEYYDITTTVLPALVLTAGSPNLIAIETHNTTLDSSDCSMDLRLSIDDPRADCPTGLACDALPADGTVDPPLPVRVELSWTNSTTVAYDEVRVTRNGTPITGSPFAGDTQMAVDTTPGNFFNRYEVAAVIGGVVCDVLFCEIDECPTGIACVSRIDGVTISWTNSALVAYDEISVTRDGTPIAGSPFPGGTSSVVDASPGDFLNEYEVTATIGGEDCDPPLTCTSTNALELLGENEEWRFFRGTQAPSDPPTDWRTSGFDDALWETGATGIGYGDTDDMTVLDDMEDAYVSYYCRKVVSIPSLAAISSLVFDIDYDDGYIAYLNGTEFARSGTMTDPNTPNLEFAFDDEALGLREAGSFSAVDITHLIGVPGGLQAGNNVFAVEIHNESAGSSDASFIPRLSANGCVTPALSCVFDETTNEVTITLPAFSADSIAITRNGTPLSGSPFPNGTTTVVDPSPIAVDNTYEVTVTVAGRACPPSSCSITCETRDPTALTCALSLVADGGGGFQTQADLSWALPAGSIASIDVEREGALIDTLGPGETSYTDPDVESAEPEDDTEFTVVFNFTNGSTCSIGCPAQSLCPEGLACEVVDDGGVLRAALSWGNVVKEWEMLNIDRDGTVIAMLSGTATSYLDNTIVQVPGEIHTYTLIPVAPAGEEVTTCDSSCTVSAQVPELASYNAPSGGWDYFIDFSGGGGAGVPNLYNPTAGEDGNLDGNWIRAVGLDSWDGSAPLEFGAAPDGDAPGGVDVETDIASSGAEEACGGETSVLRMLDPGDPSNPGGSLADDFPDPYTEPNNRTIFLGLDTLADSQNLLRSGVTFTARWRVRPPASSPAYLGASATGDGQPLDGGRGHVGIYFQDADDPKTMLPSLGQGSSAALAFALESGDTLEMSSEPVSELAGHDIDRFRALWVTCEDPDGDEVYTVTLYMNGATTPAAFFGTGDHALQEPDLTTTIATVETPFFGKSTGNFLAIGLPGAGQDSDIEIDYIGYKRGVHAPTSTPCSGGTIPFQRGDCNNDGSPGGNVTNVVFLLGFLFLGDDPPTCFTACDFNGDGAVPGNTADVIFYLSFNFLGGPPIPEPRLTCAPSSNPLDIALGCQAYVCGGAE